MGPTTTLKRGRLPVAQRPWQGVVSFMPTSRFSEVLGALALAADMSAALPPDTSLRTCLIALGLGRAHGLDQPALSDVFLAALLRHIRCASSAYEETGLMGDEMELRSSMALVDAGSPIEIFNAARRGFGKGRAALTRAKRVAAFMARGPKES